MTVFSSSKSHTEPISTWFSFDCSWNPRGWQGKEGVVAAISKDTGKIVDVVHKSRSYLLCKKMKEKHEKDELSGLEYMTWQVKHEPSSMMNHTGSLSVGLSLLTLQLS